ncbi:MAG: MFS transporter, partial [Desulfopila sp.]
LEIIRQPSFWQLCVLLSMAVGVETGVYAMTPLYLVNERGFALSEANQLLGLSRIPSVALVLLSGWLTDRLSPTKAVAAALAVTGCALIGMGLGSAGVLVICVFLLAAAAACLFPPMLSMASAISTTENRALTLSLSIAVAPVIGSGLLPAAIAFTADIFSFAVGFTGTGLLLLAGIGLVKRQ